LYKKGDEKKTAAAEDVKKRGVEKCHIGSTGKARTTKNKGDK
jgi:hypothetical protein